MEVKRLRVILLDPGLAHSRAAGLVKNFLGWTRGRCLMSFGLTHPFQHVGEIGSPCAQSCDHLVWFDSTKGAWQSGRPRIQCA